MKKVLLLSSVLAFSLCANEVKNLNDMTVTAQKTEESVQDVPIAMSVFSDVGLEDKAIVSVQDLAYFVPNFYLLSTGDEGIYAPTIRGITSDPTTMISTVGLYIDGIPTANSVGFEAVLDDVQRVEVLRGPQGTLYGKNSEAGVINVVTKKPNNEIEGKISLEYGEDNKQMALATVRTPIIKDKLFVGITGRYYNKNGNMDNTFLNERLNDRRNYFGKIYLRATPTDRLELALIGSIFQRDDGATSYNALSSPEHRKYPSNVDGYNKNSDKSYALKVKYDFDKFILSSTTSYAKHIIDTFGDNDFTSARLSDFKRDFEFTTLSQELKLDGEYNNLKWLFGLFGSQDENKNEFSMTSDVEAMNMQYHSETKSRSFGAFTHLNYAFSDKLNLIGGIRYDRDKSKLNFIAVTNEDEKTSSDISPKIALEYKWNKNLMTYATISKGYKSGGFYPMAAQGYPVSYESESLWNYELGFKSATLDNKLILNADIYYMDINDMQVTTAVDTSSGYISNAASATSYGFELDANYAINSGFSIFGSFGYNETKFDEFKDAFGSYNDNYTTFAPKYNYALGGQFRGFGGFYASANLQGYGKMYLNNANTSKQKAYTLVNSKIGYEWDDFDIYLYADNLFNKNYDLVGYYGNYVMINPDREIGVKFTYRF